MNDNELPDEIRALIRPGPTTLQTMGALGVTIAKMRDEAVAARGGSGIEYEWMQCEDAYIGIDDLNRGEFQQAKWAKPMTTDGPLVRVTNRDDDARATAFVRLTSRYVDAGAAKVCEIAIPVDGKPFTLKATPVPETDAAAEDTTPAEQITGEPMPGPNGQPVTVQDLAKHAIEMAEKAAEKAATRIHDWMVEYKHETEMRALIFDAARIGTGIMKGPIPEECKSRKVSKVVDPKTGKKGIKLEFVSKIKPAARRVDPWRFYPAPGCGEDVNRGGHCFEVDPMLAGELAALGKQRDGYFDKAAIDKVIVEGPGKCNLYGLTKAHAKQFDVWHMTGSIPRADFEAANPEQAGELEREKDRVNVIVTLVNDTVIRAVLNPLESGALGYHVFTWHKRQGSWAGVGVAEQVRAPQRIVNGATRAMLNNGGKSAGSQIVIDEDGIRPADGSWKITPDKVWYMNKTSGIDDVRKAFAAFQWPNMTEQLMRIVEYGFRLAEEDSSIPLISQGQSGKTTPDTFSGQQLQDNNAQQLLRDVGFGLNGDITVPLVDLFYEWLLSDPEIADDEKGDYKVDTSGALAMIEKALKDRALLALLGMDPARMQAFGVDPRSVFEVWCRANRMAPSEFQYSKERQKEIDAQQPPPPPQVQAAQIRAASAEKIAQTHDALLSHKVDVDTDRDRAYNASLAARDQATVSMRLEELKLTRDLKMLDYALQERISLQDAKVRLADTTMKLQVTRELSEAKTDKASHDGPTQKPVLTPPTEPAGRADEGRSYEQ